MMPDWRALAAAGVLAGCTSLGGTVRGDFSCRAVQGTCAPLSANDADAVAVMTRGRAPAPGRERIVAGGAERAGERLLTILVPAHVDADGALHDAATVHVVAEPARWQAVAIASSPSTRSARSLPPSLREVIAGASAPAMEGPGFSPGRAPHPFPSAAALEAARAGRRIERPSLIDPLRASPIAPGTTASPLVLPMAAPLLAAPAPAEEPR